MSNSISEPPKVFISYSWDSEKHKDKVLDLADRLRRDGVDCSIDQYETSPAQGWPRWMRDQIDRSDFVIAVCSEKYNLRFTGREEPGKGKGVGWEGAIIDQIIYDQKDKNKFIPVIFSPQDSGYIPVELGRFTFYLLDTEKGYEGLYRHLTHQPLSEKPKLGERRPLLPRQRRWGGGEASDLPTSSETGELEGGQQKRLDELYQKVRQHYKARRWQPVLDTFGQMTDEGLPYFDPEELYRPARDKLREEKERREKERREQEQKIRNLENLYAQGSGCYNNRDWHEARRRFEAILRLEPGYRDTERWLARIQEKQDIATKVSIGMIVMGWIISGLIDADIGMIGGLLSGWAIGRLCRRGELTPEQKMRQTILFLGLGIASGAMLGLAIKSLDFAGSAPVERWITASLGAAIALVAMFWQLRQIESGN